MRRPTANQATAGTALSSLALLLGQHFLLVAPEQARAEANKNNNYSCAAQLQKEEAISKDWRDRWFVHAREQHGW